VLYAALAAAEVCWAAPVFLLVVESRSPHPPLSLWLAMVALLLGFFYIYRLLVRVDLSLRRQQSLLAGVLLLSIFLILRFHVYGSAGLRGIGWFLQPVRSFASLTSGVPLEFVAMLTLTYLWARAILLARRSLSARSVGFSFRSGVVILIAITWAISLFADEVVLGFIIPYFFFSLVAVGLARVEEVSRAPNSTRVRFGAFWIAATAAAVGLLIVVGMAVASLFYGGTLEQVLRWMLPLLILVQLLVVGLGLILFTVVEFILRILPVNWDALAAALQRIAAALSDLAPPAVDTGEIDQAAIERTMGAVQASCLTGIIVVFIAAVLLLSWWRLYRDRDRDGDESRESVLSAGALANNLLALLQAGRDRLGQLAGLVDQFGLGSRLLSAITIRRIYANLVRLATRSGYPRPRSQTPFEYMETLREVFPGRESDVAMITAAYVSAHYGEVPDSRGELEQIRGCWERIRTQGIETQRQEDT
jgi:hypothetical protein